MKENSSINVVVIGAVHHNTLGVVRSLGEAKIKKDNIIVFLVGAENKKNIVSTSKYLKKDNIIFLETDSEIVEKLDLIAVDKVKRVIICCSDGSAEEVIKNNERLKEFFYCPSTKIDISHLMEKEEQTKIAIACGLKAPYSTILNNENYKEWNKFPCIVKPLKSIIGDKSDIKILNNLDELSEIVNSEKKLNLQIQEYLKKQFEFQLIGCSLNDGNDVIIPGYTNIVRQPKNTNTGYLKYSPILNFEFDKESVLKFLKTIGYNGLFSIEFIRATDNADYFLEINMRNDGNAYCVQSAGINLPFLWCFYNFYGKFPEMSFSFSKSLFFMPEFSDFKREVKTVGIFKWIKQFVCAKSHAIANRKDPRPFWNKMFSSIFKKNKGRIK